MVQRKLHLGFPIRVTPKRPREIPLIVATPKALRNPTLEARGRSGLTTPPLVQFQAVRLIHGDGKIGNGMILFATRVHSVSPWLPPPAPSFTDTACVYRVAQPPRPADGPEQQDLLVPSCSVASFRAATAIAVAPAAAAAGGIGPLLCAGAGSGNLRAAAPAGSSRIARSSVSLPFVVH